MQAMGCREHRSQLLEAKFGARGADLCGNEIIYQLPAMLKCERFFSGHAISFADDFSITRLGSSSSSPLLLLGKDLHEVDKGLSRFLQTAT